MSAKLSINEKFFYENSKEMFYVLGAAFRCCSPQNNNYCTFRSRYRGLVEIVKKEIECEHTILADPRGRRSYFLQMYDEKMCDILKKKWGLVQDKSKRKFPEFNYNKYLNHFARGFFDAVGIVKTRENRSNVVVMEFYPKFLKDFNKALKKYAGVERDYSGNKRLIFGHYDAVNFYNFIYKDWKFIEKSGLFLPFKKELFNTGHESSRLERMMLRKESRRNDVITSIDLLLKGMRFKDVLQRISLSRNVLDSEFKEYVGVPPGMFEMYVRYCIKSYYFGLLRDVPESTKKQMNKLKKEKTMLEKKFKSEINTDKINRTLANEVNERLVKLGKLLIF